MLRPLLAANPFLFLLLEVALNPQAAGARSFPFLNKRWGGPRARRILFPSRLWNIPCQERPPRGRSCGPRSILFGHFLLPSPPPMVRGRPALRWIRLGRTCVRPSLSANYFSSRPGLFSRVGLARLFSLSPVPFLSSFSNPFPTASRCDFSTPLKNKSCVCLCVSLCVCRCGWRLCEGA